MRGATRARNWSLVCSDNSIQREPIQLSTNNIYIRGVGSSFSKVGVVVV